MTAATANVWPDRRAESAAVARRGHPSRAIKGSIVALVSSIFVFPQFGLNLTQAYSANFSLLACYLFLAILMLKRAAVCSASMVALYGAVLACGVMSLWTNGWGPSPSSLLLFAAIYFPFLFRAKKVIADQYYAFAVRTFANFAFIVGIIGCLQFCLQFVISADWLFNFGTYLPDQIRASGAYNTVIQIGNVKKSNGFFIPEPSGFSMLMSFGVLIEYYLLRRRLRIAVLILAMIVSYSGTGILILLVGLFAPVGLASIPRIVILGSLAGLGYWFLQDVLNLSAFTGRLSEFGQEGTSAYARFIAPTMLVIGEFNDSVLTPLLGHGPGAITLRIKALKSSYEIHDPTWAKMVYEYGLAGTTSMVLYVVSMLSGKRMNLQFCVAMFYAWLASGGQLLSPDFMAIVFILIAVWPGRGDYHLKAKFR